VTASLYQREETKRRPPREKEANSEDTTTA
jgi:hypothetical protein